LPRIGPCRGTRPTATSAEGHCAPRCKENRPSWQRCPGACRGSAGGRLRSATASTPRLSYPLNCPSSQAATTAVDYPFGMTSGTPPGHPELVRRPPTAFAGAPWVYDRYPVMRPGLAAPKRTPDPTDPVHPSPDATLSSLQGMLSSACQAVGVERRLLSHHWRGY
jgi:hypothetical protein